MNDCSKCKFLLRHDRGYSNYTVTDTELICLKRLNGKLPKEEEYQPAGGDPDLLLECSGFATGDPLYIDCEEEAVPYPRDDRSIASFYTDDPEVIAAFDAMGRAKDDAMGGWQPIETAPKDGTVILVSSPEGMSISAYCAGDWMAWCEGDPVKDPSSGWGLALEHATHWMPLPEPPK